MQEAEERPHSVAAMEEVVEGHRWQSLPPAPPTSTAGEAAEAPNITHDGGGSQGPQTVRCLAFFLSLLHHSDIQRTNDLGCFKLAVESRKIKNNIKKNVNKVALAMLENRLNLKLCAVFLS